MSDLSSMMAPTGADPFAANPVESMAASVAAPTGFADMIEPAGFAAANPIAIDPVNLTQQFQAISQFNEASPLPDIPAGVALDVLASPELPDAAAVSEFFYGLEADLRAVEQRLRASAAQPTGPEVTTEWGPEFQAENSFLSQARRIANDIAGTPWNRPTIVPGDPSAAVLEFKRDAIARGLLPQDTPIDASWDPAMNNAWYDLANERTGEKLAGEGRVGAFSVAGVGRLMDDWLSPTSLLSAAVALDFVPDFGAIGREWEEEGGLSGWLGNIADYANEPWNIKKLGKALGPIDDLAFPVLNTMALVSGVGAVAGFWRAGRAIKAATSLRGASLVGSQAAQGAARASLAGAQTVGMGTMLGRGMQSVAPFVDDVVRMNQPGLLASRLQQGRVASRLPGAAAIGSGMARWRQFEGVQMARYGVAQGMQLGVLSMVQSSISPDRTLGLTIPGLGTEETHAARIEQMKQWRTSNPLVESVAIALEPAFTPVSIFRAGTLTGPLHGVNKAARQRFINLTLDEQLGTVLYGGMQARIAAMPADQRQAYQGLTPGDAVVRFFSGSSTIDNDARQVAGEKITWLLTNKAISKEADTVARQLVADPANKIGNFERIRLAVKGHFENRLRVFDAVNFDPTDYEQVRQAMALRAGLESDDLLTSAQRTVLDPAVAGVMSDGDDIIRIRTASVEAMMADFADPKLGTANLEQFRQELQHHEDLRRVTFHDLLDKVDETDIYEALEEYGDTLERWDDFLAGTDMLERLDFQHMDLVPVFDRVEDIPWMTSKFGEQVAQYLPAGHPERIARVQEYAINPLQRAVQAGHKSITVARKNTPDRAQIGFLQESLYRLGRMADAVTALGGRLSTKTVAPEFYQESLARFAAENAEDGTIAGLGIGQVRRWATSFGEDGENVTSALTALTPEQVTFLADEFAPAMAHFTAKGMDIDDIGGQVNRLLDDINNAPFWKDIDPISRVVFDPVAAVSRQSSLDEKIEQLRQIRDLTGAEVQVPAPVWQALDDMGYKAVVGDQYLQFPHLTGLNAPFADITNAHLRRRSLGTFMTRQEHSRLNSARQALFTERLRDGVRRLKAAGNWDGPAGFDPESSDDMQELIGILSSHHRAGLEAIARGEEITGAGMSKFFQRAARQGYAYSFYENANIKVLQQVLNSDGMPEYLQGWDKKSLKVLRGALLGSRNVGWEYRGLGAIGDRMASESWVKGALKTLAFSDAGESVGAMGALKRTALGIGTHRDEADTYRMWRAMGYAVAGGVLGGVSSAMNTDSEGVAGNPLAMAGLGALGGAAAGFGADSGTGFRTAVRGAGAMLVGQAVAGATDNDTAGLTAAGVAAFPGFGILRKTAGAAVRKADANAWGEYAKLFEPYERVRNQIRFSLSPVFDLQRYTEGWTLAGFSTYKDSDGVIHQIPGGLRPWREVEKRGGNIDTAMAKFRQAAQGQEWHDALTWTDARLAEVGILGYSPTKAMAAVHWQLVEAGQDPYQAVGMVKEIFQYGEKARTGLEQSVNFVFFPFSFQKHYLSKMASFAAEDIGRAVMVHDAIKMYSVLEEQTGFHDIVDRHLPVLEQLRKLNGLAYGISPGQFGGINRPTWNLIRATPGLGQVADAFANATVMQAFAPVGLRIESKASAEELATVARQMLPFWRDSADLYEDLVDQGYVVTSRNHVRKRIDAQEGWQEWGELRSARDRVAQELGVSVSQMMSRENPQYTSIQQWFENERRRLFEDRPAFAESYEKSVRNNQKRGAELRSRTIAPNTTQEEFDAFVRTGRTANPDLALLDFSRTLDLMTATYDELGIEDLPMEAVEALRGKAIELAIDSPRFLALYNRFYARALGPIEKEISGV